MQSVYKQSNLHFSEKLTQRFLCVWAEVQRVPFSSSCTWSWFRARWEANVCEVFRCANVPFVVVFLQWVNIICMYDKYFSLFSLRTYSCHSSPAEACFNCHLRCHKGLRNILQASDNIPELISPSWDQINLMLLQQRDNTGLFSDDNEQTSSSFYLLWGQWNAQHIIILSKRPIVTIQTHHDFINTVLKNTAYWGRRLWPLVAFSAT